jgi:glycosyltransferase involved in cell wall biosynthesis
MAFNDGIGRYAIALIDEFSRRDDGHEYVVLKNPRTKVSFEVDSRFREIVVSAARFSLKEQVVLPRLLAPLGLDLFHSLHAALPLAYRGVMVMTVHDLLPVLYPWILGRSGLKNKVGSTYFAGLLRSSVRRATFVAVASENTRRDLISHLGVKPERVRKIYQGINQEEFATPPGAETIPGRVGLTGPFFLTVTNFKPHKNTEMLLRAFRIFRERIPNVQLAIVGADERGLGKTLGTPTGLASEGIHILGYQDDETLAGLMAMATAFVFPSLYEGFGLPILEAMAWGAPVITSSASSLPELGGDAVLYIDPNDPVQIAQAMQKLYSDAALRAELRRKGKTQAGTHRWKDNADGVLLMYSDAVHRRRRTSV